MTSLFEMCASEPVQEMPMDLVQAGGRGVSLLEFMAVDAPDPEPEATASEEPLPEELEAHQVAERAAQVRLMVDVAREEAAAHARAGMELECERRVRGEQLRVNLAIHEFAGERRRYFAEIEGEVLRLALAIASRVLAREVFGDPMHLRGVVRAALSRVQDDSAVVLRVRAEDVDHWAARLAEDGAERVQVQADKSCEGGELLLETSVGRVELGVSAQLDEVGRLFREQLGRLAEASSPPPLFVTASSTNS